jgi:hypothetical protein
VVREAVEMLQPRAAIGLSGGNPIAGASSTLGMRIGSVPRITVAARVTGVKLGLPSVNATEDIGNLATSLNLDAAVGIFSGFRVFPTIGGFGSLDAVGSVGTLRLPDDDGFRSDPSSWALGARLGILRESFTAPGVSITAMYRHIGDVKWVLPNDDTGDAFQFADFAMTDNSTWSIRGVVGKRLFVLGAAVGIGYDKYTSDISGTYNCVVGCVPSAFKVDNHKTDRKTIFANVSWTLLILNLVAEGGWQEGGDRFTAPLTAGRSSKSENSTGYGSLAIRLAL